MEPTGLAALITALSGALAVLFEVFRRRRRNAASTPTAHQDILTEYRKLVEELRRESARLRRVSEAERKSCLARVQFLTTRLVALEAELDSKRAGRS